MASMFSVIQFEWSPTIALGSLLYSAISFLQVFLPPQKKQTTLLRGSMGAGVKVLLIEGSICFLLLEETYDQFPLASKSCGRVLGFYLTFFSWLSVAMRVNINSQQILTNMSSPDNSTLYTRQYSEVFGCSHLNQVCYQEKTFCQQCGIFSNNSSTRVYKTLKMKYNAFFDPIRILNIALQPKNLEPNTNHQRLQVIEFLEQAADRLRLTHNTIFLAMTYLDALLVKQALPDSHLFLYAATALMLAAKAQELDERIPFISKLKRYASMTSHPEINQFRNEEFKCAERVLIQTMDWKLQQITLFDKIEALLSFGVVDDDDSLGNAQKENKVDELKKSKAELVHQKMRDLTETQILVYVKEIESKYADLAVAILKEDSLYFKTDQSLLALSCVAYLRKKAGLLNIWSQQLQALTGVSAQKISSIVSQIMTIMGKVQGGKMYRNSTHHSYLEVTQQGQAPSTLNTPTGVYPLTSYPYNTQPNRFVFDGSKKSIGETHIRSQAKLTAPPTLYTSQSTLSLPQKESKLQDSKIRKGRNNQFTYLNFNENLNHPTYLTHFTSFNSDLDKKYEQVHKVSGNNTSLLRTKIYTGIQQ